MDASVSVKDRNGRAVTVGEHVRILSVSPDPDMDEDELDMIMFMVGAISEVEKIDEEGRAWVTMWWNCVETTAVSSVGLFPHEMEWVPPEMA
ncbi:hypothetical protein [Zoogloea sp.]|uniref:hypothetical protein n=1 Tax=Zoogloea sp. TaxID=49181 RepID=UPI0035AE6D93